MTRLLSYGVRVTGVLLTGQKAIGQNRYVFVILLCIWTWSLHFCGSHILFAESLLTEKYFLCVCVCLQLGSTFFRRLAWSPCGHFITTTHGFQKPRHSAPVLERGEWSATFDFLGHNAPVVVVKFNHSMFRKHLSSGQDAKAAPAGWANGASKASSKEHQPYNVIAIGSQDRTITVWTTASARPLFVAKHFFTQSVVDLSWYVNLTI